MAPIEPPYLRKGNAGETRTAQSHGPNGIWSPHGGRAIEQGALASAWRKLMRSLILKLAGAAIAATLLLSVAPARASLGASDTPDAVPSALLAQSAAADTLGDEQSFATQLNDLRAGLGLPALAMEVRLVEIARTWSGQM